MFKNIFFISLLVIFSFKVNAQETLNQKEALVLKNNIIKKSNIINSIISDFVQYKHLSFLSKDIKSNGKLVFKAPNLIKWEYKTPFKYSVVFKENKLFINDDGTKSDLDLSANRAFKSLNNLIIKSVKGDMFDEDQFQIAYFKNNKNYMISFISKEDSLKSFISKFELIFDAKTYNVIKIKMIESAEDFTTIVFSNQKINEPVNDAIFSN